MADNPKKEILKLLYEIAESQNIYVGEEARNEVSAGSDDDLSMDLYDSGFQSDPLPEAELKEASAAEFLKHNFMVIEQAIRDPDNSSKFRRHLEGAERLESKEDAPDAITYALGHLENYVASNGVKIFEGLSEVYEAAQTPQQKEEILLEWLKDAKAKLGLSEEVVIAADKSEMSEEDKAAAEKLVLDTLQMEKDIRNSQGEDAMLTPAEKKAIAENLIKGRQDAGAEDAENYYDTNPDNTDVANKPPEANPVNPNKIKLNTDEKEGLTDAQKAEAFNDKVSKIEVAIPEIAGEYEKILNQEIYDERELVKIYNGGALDSFSRNADLNQGATEAMAGLMLIAKDAGLKNIEGDDITIMPNNVRTMLREPEGNLGYLALQKRYFSDAKIPKEISEEIFKNPLTTENLKTIYDEVKKFRKKYKDFESFQEDFNSFVDGFNEMKTALENHRDEKVKELEGQIETIEAANKVKAANVQDNLTTLLKEAKESGDEEKVKAVDRVAEYVEHVSDGRHEDSDKPVFAAIEKFRNGWVAELEKSPMEIDQEKLNEYTDATAQLFMAYEEGLITEEEVSALDADGITLDNFEGLIVEHNNAEGISASEQIFINKLNQGVIKQQEQEGGFTEAEDKKLKNIVNELLTDGDYFNLDGDPTKISEEERAQFETSVQVKLEENGFNTGVLERLANDFSQTEKAREFDQLRNYVPSGANTQEKFAEIKERYVISENKEDALKALDDLKGIIRDKEGEKNIALDAIGKMEARWSENGFDATPVQNNPLKEKLENAVRSYNAVLNAPTTIDR